MASRKLLVVTGDYGVVQQVKQALGGKNFTIHAAYSHLDAIYQLKFEPFDLLLVDAAMVNRKSGERTAITLAQIDGHPPMLVYAPPNGGTDRWPPGAAINGLDEDTVCRSVARILGLPPLIAPPPSEPTSAEPKPGTNTSVFWRDEEMQTLFALSRSLTEVLDLSEVLNRIVEAARRLTDAEEGMILLPDGQSGQLYLRAKVGIDVGAADNFRIKTHDTIAGAVFESGQPILLGESGPQKVKTEYFVNSLLYVAIIHQGQTLGVLGVNNKQKHDIFTERHRDLLVNLASYAAVAIENARAHGQSIRRQHELKALIDASQSINESLEFDHTLAAICEQLSRVVNVGQAEIYQWQRESQQLELLARHQNASWHGAHDALITLAQRPLANAVLESRRYAYLKRDRQEVRGENQHLWQIGAGATLALPILSGDQPLGVAQAYYLQAPDGGLSSEVVARAQRLLIELMASDDEHRAFRLLQEALALVGADWIESAALVPESRALRMQLAVGSGVWINEPRPQIEAAAYPDVLEALDRQQPLNHFQGEENLPEGALAFLSATASRSLLALPLIGRGQAVGLVLFIDTLHARPFSAREIDLGRAIVGQAATALENVGLVHDLEISVRDLREAQNRLVQSARLSAMGELAAAVAHQINNPLTTIVLDTELLLESTSAEQDERTYEVLSAISRAGKRAAGVVRRLLAMARPISPDAARIPINVPDTIEDILALVRPHIEREGIRLITRLPGETIPAVLAAPGELNDVWLNLILNAHDAVLGRSAPEIGISTGSDAAMVEVTVWDNGPGIPDEIVGEIFKPFFTTKPQGEGTGLGLHICRQVIERVGGTISVQTSASGTRFVVRLPNMRST